MRKTTRNYFYLFFILLLTTQYIHNSFTNAEVKTDSKEINDRLSSTN